MPSRAHLCVTALLCVGGHASAQGFPDVNRPATTAEVIAGNVLIGGLTAVGRALISGKDPFRAFTIGAIGGAVHLTGKNLAAEPGPLPGILGLAVAGTGTSIVANAGRGVSPLREIAVPFASTRVRITPCDASKVALSINAFESLVIAHTALRDGARMDWSRTMSSGAVVFIAPRRRIVRGDRELNGIALSPTVMISGFADDIDRVVRHEVVHAHQQWFLDEAIGRPIEDAVRRRIPGGSRIPRWLDIGIVSPVLKLGDAWLTNDRGFGVLAEAEAMQLEKR